MGKRESGLLILLDYILDPAGTSDIEIEGLAKAILEIPNGIHALCLVIDVTKRIHSPDVKVLTQLLGVAELIHMQW